MEAVISKFYTSFAKLDTTGMVAQYHDDVVFEDPAFGILRGERAKSMWRMLCQSQKNKNTIFEVVINEITSDGDKGFAKWEAIYTFSQTGRKVHNVVCAEFEFKDNLIIRHTDTFSLQLWAKQAMGFKGFLLGGTSFFKSKLQKKTNLLLDDFIVAKK